MINNKKEVFTQILSKKIWICCFTVLTIFLSGCFHAPREEITKFNSLKALQPENYPEIIDDFDFQNLIISIDNSLKYFKRVPLTRQYQYGKNQYNAAHLIASLEIFKSFLLTNPSDKDLERFIKSKFIIYEAAGNEEEQVLFTGYFEPTYEGSIEKHESYKFPVYSIPDDLLEINLSAFSSKYKGHKRLVGRVNDSKNRIIPYYSRAQINMINDFYKRAEPIAWLKSRIDRFFLEIQGSGRVTLENKEILRLHYAKSNGNAYSSVGRYLIKKNEILKENMSMQAIRLWLENHPDRMDEVLHHNESFVFFQEEDGGPYGSLGVEVTALRSIATDASLFPKGALCFIQSKLPQKLKKDDKLNNASKADTADKNFSKEWEKTSFFVINQDTGGAIKGSARADLFCGNGDYAEYTAGHMNQYGKLFFLVLRP